MFELTKRFRSLSPARRAGAAVTIGLAAALLYTHPWHQARRPVPLSPAARLASRAREKKEGLPRIFWTPRTPARTPPRAPEAEAQALQEELWSGIFIFLLAGATTELVLGILALALASAAGRNDDGGGRCSRSQS
ncbi:MAG: hypothetical protein ACYCS1_09270 [Gammaproteobacteria bacterium]